MKSILVLSHLSVEAANAVTGMVWGFPAMTHFLGFSHALQRKLQTEPGNEALALRGVAVVSHNHQIQGAVDAAGYFRFAATRNPLGKVRKDPLSTALIADPRMWLDVSLMIECNFEAENLEFDAGSAEHNTRAFESWVLDQCQQMRLAGGSIVNVGRVSFLTMPNDPREQERFQRRQLMKLLPGFALVARPDVLAEHLAELKETNPDAELLDAWLDFTVLTFKADELPEDAPDDAKVDWNMVDKPADGYLVPMATGYQALSEVYTPGTVLKTRDPSKPFVFVEPAYTVGQWLSPHRVMDLSDIFWDFATDANGYWCNCRYRPAPAETDLDVAVTA